MLKNLRIRIFNWFAAGKLSLTYNKPQEYNSMSTYTIGGSGSGPVLNIGPNGNMTYSTNGNNMQTKQTLTIKITPANGGTIIQTFTDDYSNSSELHIVPDGVDFDRELGKIITMSKLKS